MSKISLLIVVALLISACGDQKGKEQPASPRIKKETKLTSPSKNQKFKVGEEISFAVKAEGLSVDSIIVDLGGEVSTQTELSFNSTYSSPKVGELRAKVTVYFNNKKETHYRKVTFLPVQAPKEYTFEIINTYPHDPNDYTQGLMIADGFLYESTGRNGNSTLEKKNIETGETLAQLNLTDDYFGEGLTVVGDQFYQLTYTSGACFVYDENFERIKSFSYQGEGWGLCEFQGNLLMTNGSEKISIRNPNTFSVIDELQVYDSKGKVEYLNELEVIDGLIYANVYQESYIVVIDPKSGAVVEKIDLKELLSEVQGSGQIDVLNGIAYDQVEDRIFVTGKLWPKLFELKFVPKNQS